MLVKDLILRLRSQILLLFCFLFPVIIFAFLAAISFQLSDYYLKLTIVENFFFSAVLCFFLITLPFGRCKRNFTYLLYGIVVLKIFIQASYLNLYSYSISASTIFIILETNFNEAIEYLQNYLKWFNLFLLIVLLAPFLMLHYLANEKVFQKKADIKSMVLPGSFLIISLFIYEYKDLSNFNLYFTSWKSYQKYEEQSSIYDMVGLDRKEGEFKNVHRKNPGNRQVHVLVLGESTTRHRMGIYGYPRETTPKLSVMQDELEIYSNVISPHTHTIKSLSKLLTLNNYENNKLLSKGSLVQLMNQAGFETYWISNQRPVGIHENLVTKMAKASTKTYFLNSRNFNVSTPYDEVVMGPLKKVLRRNKDLFIVIHLLGTHVGYNQRYPKGFNFFKGSAPLTNEKSGNSVVNEYDNAVLYGDYVLSEIISAVKSQGTSSWVMYLSDHGEDVYQIKKGASHTESNGTYPMYDVPFVLWKSKDFEIPKDVVIKEDRGYMLDDLIYSIADLSQIRFSSFDARRSIFNKDFESRKREIYNKQDYDSIFKKK